LRPLKLEVRDLSIKINGIEKLVMEIGSKNFYKFKNIASIASDIPHLALVNDSRDTAQILTSSKQV
jgi:hypothetical protein